MRRFLLAEIIFKLMFGRGFRRKRVIKSTPKSASLKVLLTRPEDGIPN
jgi:hypothetical protein